MKAMLLAAGRGERMRPLTDHTPKALLRAGEQSLIERHLEALAANGFSEVVINIAHLRDHIRAALGDGRAFGLTIHYSDEDDHVLETGGGIVNALPLLGDEPFLVVNADIWTDYRPDPAKTPAEGDLAHLVLVDNPAYNPDGDFALEAGRVRADGEVRLTFAGIGYYRPELFRSQLPSRFPLAPILREAIDLEAVSGERHPGHWFDVGTPERLRELQDWLAASGH